MLWDNNISWRAKKKVSLRFLPGPEGYLGMIKAEEVEVENTVQTAEIACIKALRSEEFGTCTARSP